MQTELIWLRLSVKTEMQQEMRIYISFPPNATKRVADWTDIWENVVFFFFDCRFWRQTGHDLQVFFYAQSLRLKNSSPMGRFSRRHWTMVKPCSIRGSKRLTFQLIRLGYNKIPTTTSRAICKCNYITFLNISTCYQLKCNWQA